MDKGGKELIQFHRLPIQQKCIASLKLPMCESYITPSFQRDSPEFPLLLYNIQLTLKTRELVKQLLTQKENKYLNLPPDNQI